MILMAAVQYTRGFDIDRLLVDACAIMVREGLRIGGLLQVTTGARGGNCAATNHVVDLRTERAFDIWEPRGQGARGCRLDERGLTSAEPILRTAIADRVDLLVINRFGRAESQGRGLRASFEAAVTHGVPVLTAVRAPYDEAWSKFHAGLARDLDFDAKAVASWALGTKLGDAELKADVRGRCDETTARLPA